MALWAEFLISLQSLSHTFSAFKTGGGTRDWPASDPDVKGKDISKLNRTIQKRIKTAIEQKLLVSPEKYSEPLRRTLKGYRKLKVWDYRIVQKIEGADILILGSCHRKDVYERMEWRNQ